MDAKRTCIALNIICMDVFEKMSYEQQEEASIIEYLNQAIDRFLNADLITECDILRYFDD